MTNWMTAAGIALIAGGLATLICFRAILFSAGSRRARRARPPETPRARGSRRRTRVDVAVAAPAVPPAPVVQEEPEPVEDDVVSVLRAIEAEEAYEPDFLAGDEEELPEPRLHLVPDVEHYGDRVEGWVRPEYRHVREVPPAGEYWTPIPVDLDPDPEPSAKGYGWPSPVERLPSVPNYEPAGGFDPDPLEHEPTEVVTGNRVHPQRSWAVRNEKREYRREAGRDRRVVEELPPAREWRREHEPVPGGRRSRMADDPTPLTNRRRPRPRPRPAEPPPADRSTQVYVSRHAAEPPPR